MVQNDKRPVMVTIRCIVFNQEKYIKDCLEGIVNQQTNFRYEAIVHDDASSDHTTDIIREYEEKYPNIIKPIYENENQYSKHDGSLRRIMDDNTRGKYVAVCEGDDYWIDPLKLQKQYDFMEENLDCSLCFHANYIQMVSGEKKIHRPARTTKYYTAKDIILGGGGIMATNSMFYRWNLIKNEKIPEFWEHSPVGDMPRMLFLVAKGKFGYIDEIMSVYRAAADGSWSLNYKSKEFRKNHHKAIMRMFDEYDEYTHHRYHFLIVLKKTRNKMGYLYNILRK